MPILVPSGPVDTGIDKDVLSSRELEGYIFERCGAIIDAAYLACRDVYVDRFYMWKDFYEWLPWLVALAIVVVALVLVYIYRQQIENATAGSIRRKRRISANMSDIKDRIKQKANE